MQELDLIPYVPPSDEMSYAIVEYTGKPVPAFKQSTPRPPSKKLNFTQMRDYIRTNFSQGFTWDPIVVENKCVEPGQKGGASRIMNLNPTQDFIRTFFTAISKYFYFQFSRKRKYEIESRTSSSFFSTWSFSFCKFY